MPQDLGQPKKWYEPKGLRFSCTSCGKCCESHGEYSHVYVDDAEARRICDLLQIGMAEFEREYCLLDEHGQRELKFPDRACIFLDEDKRCSIYAARPNQCRTWPFWPETLKKGVWEREVLPFCPGSGKGRLYSPKEIARIARESR